MHGIYDFTKERFERGEISREQVLIERFSLLFQALWLPPTTPRMPKTATARYLGIGTGSCPAQRPAQLARPALPSLSASNGVADTQYSRLESAGISTFSGNFHFGRHGLPQAGKGLF